MDQKKIGEFIYNLRIEKKLTQDQLGEMVGVIGKSVSKWELGTTLPNYDKLEKLSQVLDISVYELLIGERIDKDNLQDINFRKIIKYYKNKYKRRFIISLILSALLICIFLISGIYLINNYDKTHIYEISNDTGEYLVKGYIILNPSKNILFIDDVTYQGNDAGTELEPKIKEVNITLKLGDKSMNYNSFDVMEPKIITDVLDTISFIVMEEHDDNTKYFSSKDNLNDLVLNLGYFDEKDEYHSVDIDLDATELFSNNKLIY